MLKEYPQEDCGRFIPLRFPNSQGIRVPDALVKQKVNSIQNAWQIVETRCDGSDSTLLVKVRWHVCEMVRSCADEEQWPGYDFVSRIDLSRISNSLTRETFAGVIALEVARLLIVRINYAL